MVCCMIRILQFLSSNIIIFKQSLNIINNTGSSKIDGILMDWIILQFLSSNILFKQLLNIINNNTGNSKADYFTDNEILLFYFFFYLFF